jgi:AhpD family alkylhydroperoxidase
MTTQMKMKLVPVLALSLTAAVAGTSRAEVSPADAARADIQKTLGFTPDFVKALPEASLAGLWAEVKGFEEGKTALSGKDKELIGLAVSAQAGSRRSVYAYKGCARAKGASPAEVAEAIGIAGLTRRMSTFMNGVQLDEGKFRAEVAEFVANVTKAAAAKVSPPPPLKVVDAASALADIKQTFGLVPEFLKRMPDTALPGAWLQMRDLEINPKTALPGKTKSLISLAVAAQIPCRYCVIADTQFAKLEGATDQEIAEAVTMAGVARNFGTLVDGLEVDEAAFRRDWDRMTGGDKSARVARRNGAAAK